MSLSAAEHDDGDEPIVAEINVTPLTDIFLVLLIIFMVTSSAMTQQGRPVDLPRDGAPASADASGAVVTASADDHLELNGKPVDLGTLGDALRAHFADGGSRNVVLRGDRSIVLDQAVRIMQIAQEAGADKIAIATTPGGRAAGGAPGAK